MSIAQDVDWAPVAFSRQLNAFSALRQNEFYKIGVVYHHAVKKTVDPKNWDNNHVGCQVAGVSIFMHLLAKRYLKLMLSLLESSSPSLTRL